MAWLAGWAKRVKITIDNTDIDAALANFPVLIYLSAVSGRDPDDLTFVFDEVGANSLKIAVTEDDGETECYVEVEKWDLGNEKAWLWAKVPAIASGADTDIYLYFDNTHADNVAHVGIPSDAVVHNVWDNNFKLVSHMGDDPDNQHIRDSTVNANDGTKKGANEPLEAVGKIGEAQDFDGGDDEVDCGTTFQSTLRGSFTLEMWFKADDGRPPTHERLMGSSDTIDAQTNRVIVNFPRQDGKIAFLYQADGNRAYAISLNVLLADGQEDWHHFAGVADSLIGAVGGLKMYLDGVLTGLDAVNDGDTAGVTFADYTSLENVALGAYNDNGVLANFFGGLIDEVRVSSTARNGAWIKASYESEIDDLLDFGVEEHVPPPTPVGIAAGVMRPFWRTQIKRTPFEALLLIAGQIRRPFLHEFYLAGGIWRPFEETGIFAATAIRRICESVTVGGFIIDDTISERAWERLFEEEDDV